MIKIIPTVFARNRKEFNERFDKLIGLKRDLHIDFMDGKFVKSKGVGLKDIPQLKKYKIKFEVHLMTFNPEKYIIDLRKKGFDKVIFHYESLREDKINELIRKIKANKMKAWIALNPLTEINNIAFFLSKIDGVLLMGVYPGKEHQKFIAGVYGKIKELRKLKKIKMQVDGGVNFNVIRKLEKLGINYANSGGFISNSENPKRALMELEK